jgi:hypothetical protein
MSGKSRIAVYLASSLVALVGLTPAVALAQPSPLEPTPADGAPAEATPSPATTAPAGADAEAEAQAAALAATMGGDDSADLAVANAEEFKLNIYGFIDFTYTQRLNDFSLASPYPTFMVGNLNLYAGAELGDGWRTLTEFRLLYVPNGTVPPDQTFLPDPTRADTTVGDPGDFGRPLRWGGVEIERAWLEYTAHPLLTIRVGQWLTPYGIWIVDHGSPVIIGVRRPYVVGEEFIPEHQTGLSLYGSTIVGTTELGYSLSLSNGRGPIDTYQDLDKNKAVTARLSLNNESPIGTISLGVTVYRGTYTDRSSRYTITSSGAFGQEYISTNRYEELSLGADARWVWNDLTVQSEFIRRETALDDRFRAAALPTPGVPPGFAPDYRSTAFYVMAAYRLPWLNIMPFFGGESSEPGLQNAFTGRAIWGGLNVRPTPRVVLKLQLTKSWSTNGAEFVGADGLEALDLQAAWSF